MAVRHPAGRPRARPRVDRRAQLLKAAGVVVARRGYANTSMKEIAAEAGVAQALLHYYFESKEELLSEVVLALDNELQSRWKAAVAPLADPLERIAVGLDEAARTVVERPDFWRLLFDLQAVALTNPLVRERLKFLADRFLEDVLDEVEKACDSFGAQPPIPPRELATALVGAIDGLAFQSVLRGDDPRPAFRALKAMSLALAGMGYQAGGKEPPFGRLFELMVGDR